MGAIDIDRGVTVRQIVRFGDTKNPRKFEPDETYGGLAVYMYKDQPGVYYDVHGHKVPDGLAKRAGFDTDRLGRMRSKELAMKAFNDKLAAELAMELDEDEVILAEASDWKIVALPMERAKVVDKTTGLSVTPVPLNRKDAQMLLKELVGSEVEMKNIEQVAKDQVGGSKKA